MSIGPIKAYVCCDQCGEETEPVELMASARGLFSLGQAIDELRSDGWLCTEDGGTICLYCQEE